MSSARSETDSIQEILERLESDAIPRYKSVNLQKNREYTLRMTVMKEALEASGIDHEDPGSVNQYYLEDLDLLVVDLDQERQRR